MAYSEIVFRFVIISLYINSIQTGVTYKSYNLSVPVNVSRPNPHVSIDATIHSSKPFHNYIITPSIRNSFQKKAVKERKAHRYEKVTQYRQKHSKDQNVISSSSGLLLHLLTLVIAATLLVILLCFVHKWRDNVGDESRYPKVQYSMLRQGENEPEDPMAEILVNIGLASPEDLRNVSDTESEDSRISSLEVTEMRENIKNGFTNVPLRGENDDLLRTRIDDSDEELLQ